MKAGRYSRAVTFQADATPAASRLPVTARAVETPAPSQTGIRTEVRGGVIYVIDRLGASPVASPDIALSYGRALRGAGLA